MDIPAAVEAVKGLGIAREHVNVHLVPDLLDPRPDLTVGISIEGLFDRPGQTVEMRQALCLAICREVEVYLMGEDIPFVRLQAWVVKLTPEVDGYVSLETARKE